VLEAQGAILRYESGSSFGDIPAAYQSTGVPGLTFSGDRRRLWALTRAIPALFGLDLDGSVLTQRPLSLRMAHALGTTHSDNVLVVDVDRHTVEEFLPAGTRVRLMGAPDQPANTGYVPGKPLSVLRSGGPFNRPAGAAGSPGGALFVADGYGNARVHCFEDGVLIRSWGEPGEGPGEFRLPHGVTTDEQGLVYIADRENGRIQVFAQNGEYFREFTGLERPCDLYVSPLGMIYVAELDPEGGRVTVLGPEGNIAARFRACVDQPQAGAHAIEVDEIGDIYVGLVPRIQKALTYGIVKFRRR